MSTSSRTLRRAALFAFAAAAITLAPPVSAQAVPSTADQKRALSIEITEATVESIDLKHIFGVAMEQYIRNVADKSGKLQEILTALTPLLRQEVEPMFAEIIGSVSRFYEDNFEVDELKSILTFTKSPVGRKQARLAAEFSARLTVTLQQAMDARRPALEAKVKAEIQRLGIKN